jgi:hypothetical protein
MPEEPPKDSNIPVDTDDHNDPEGDFDDFPIKLRGPSMRIKIMVFMAMYLVVVSLAVYEARTLMGSLLGSNQTPSERIDDGEDNQTPLPVEYLTLFHEEFDTQESAQVYWNLYDPSTTSDVRDGIACFNLTDEANTNPYSRLGFKDLDKNGEEAFWLYASLEIRLKCSDNNKLGGDIGGGSRYWGLQERWDRPDTYIFFQSWPPESTFPRPGFNADISNNSVSSSTDLWEFDMRDWHNYTILWEPENITILIDGQIVTTTNISINDPMQVYLQLWNAISGGPPIISEKLEHNISIQVDYFKLFARKELFEAWSQEINGLISEITSVIEYLEEEDFGIDIVNKSEEDLAVAGKNWQEGYYNYYATKKPLDEILNSLNRCVECLDHEEEITAMFSQASDCIELLIERGYAPQILDADYSRAEKAWSEYDLDITILYLDKIIAQCSESEDAIEK